MATAQLLPLAPLSELLEGVLADGLEHEEPVVADRLDEAVVDERAKIVEVRIADFLGRLQWERAGEDREAGEKLAGARFEEVVAPLDRRTQCPLALGGVAGTARQDGERRVEPLEEPLGREQLRPRRGQLDREREAVEAAADLLHGRVGSDLAPDGVGALDEQRGGLLLRKRLEPVLVLARPHEAALGS